MGEQSLKWLFLVSPPCNPAENMAWDEALLGYSSVLKLPLLRFYEWKGTPGTFGYFQKIAEIESMTSSRPLVRRPTGGGFVGHANDWTYSAVFPPGHDWYSLRADESYKKVHQWILMAFERIQITTELSPCCQNVGNGQCFNRAEKFDLLLDGAKIAGAAQRRNKLGLLIQGSIQPPPLNLSRRDWYEAMLSVAQSCWNVNWEKFEPDSHIEGVVRELVAKKYGNDAYNRSR